MDSLFDPSELAPVLLPFGESTMLPALCYTSPEVLAWEMRNLFAGSWTCLGRTARLAAGGNQHAIVVGDVSILITFDLAPRAFANLCRHRGHEILSLGTACDRPALVCPYHGWSYSLDGALRTAPRIELEKGRFGLVELPCVDWHGWLFVNALGDARPFEDHIGTLDSLVRPYDPGSLVLRARHEYEVQANWKIVAENYHECYHCPLIHPELCAVSPPNSGNNWHDEPGAWVGGSMELRDFAETMSHDGKSYGARLPDVDTRTVRYLGLFPNLMVSLHPDYVMTHRLQPKSPSATLVECEWLFPSSVINPAYAVDFWDVTNKQDWVACESVQRGVSSPHYRPGPLAPNENAVYDWVQLVARAYAGQDQMVGLKDLIGNPGR